VTIVGNYLEADNRNGQQTSYGIGGGGADVQGPIDISGNSFSTGFQVGPIQNGTWPSLTAIGNAVLGGVAIAVS
jgi:hypothetical protein